MRGGVLKFTYVVDNDTAVHDFLSNLFATEGHSPSRVRTGGAQSGDRGASIHATVDGEAVGGHGEE